MTIWIASFAANSTHIIETKYHLDSDNTTKRCVFQGVAGNEARAVIGIIEIGIKFFGTSVISSGVFHPPVSFHERFTCSRNNSSKQSYRPQASHTHGCHNIVGDGALLVPQSILLLTVQAQCCATEHPMAQSNSYLVHVQLLLESRYISVE